MPRFMLAIPTHSGMVEKRIKGAVHSFAGWARDSLYHIRQNSLLPFNFNMLYCEALNQRKRLGITHFVMLHADVVPIDRGECWVKTLYDEMQRERIDVISAIIPLKDESGKTSTAYYDRAMVGEPEYLAALPKNGNVRSEDPMPYHVKAKYMVYREALLKDRAAYEKKGDANVLRQIDAELSNAGTLLINTGCMIIDVTSPDAEKICFSQRDWNLKAPNGDFVPRTWPEDWNMSLMLHRWQRPYAATSKLEVIHCGNFKGYHNRVNEDGSIKLDERKPEWIHFEEIMKDVKGEVVAQRTGVA